MEIIPAIDLIDGRVVRLSAGDFNKLTEYSKHPADVAKQFEDAGIRRLHVVDLDGAKSGKPKNLKVLESIAQFTSLSIDFGGGLKETQSAQDAFNAGANFINVGSIAVKNRPLFASWLPLFGPDKIILGADCRDQKIALSGWTEESDISLIPFLEDSINLGVQQAFVTDIKHDGMLNGPAIELYKEIQASLPGLYLIASGGVSQTTDLDMLKEQGLSGVIIGKAYYEGRISLKELATYVS